jgi:hypothetical protein
VHPPNDYVDPTLWRYWEPDSSTVFPCRSYIFLLNQPSWDGKFHLADSLPNLGVRPAVDTVTEPKVDTKWDADYLTVSILEEDELHQFKWPKKIADYLDIE